MMHTRAIRTGTRPGSTPQRKRRVLVVDEDLNDLLRYSAILQHEGYEIRSMASHLEAANCIGREDFDVVIVSQGTTAFEGRSVIARAIAKNQRVPVLVLSRSSNIDGYLEAMQIGAVDYREKPLAASELVTMVARQLRRPKAWVA